MAVLSPAERIKSAKRRLLSNSKRVGKCLIYQGGKDKYGYGKFTIGNRHVSAHRASFELFKGPIQRGKHVLHSCDNPPCINPKHLRAGTPRDNCKDMWSRNRNAKNHILKQKLRTVCINGHALVGNNVYHWKGHRRCETCHRERMRKYYRESSSKPQ